MFVSYEESILSYISSIRKYYNLDSSYASNKEFDDLLNAKKPRQIFLMLVDGMGANIIDKKLNDDDLLKKNMLFKTTTVFPPTTTAATTSVLSGKAPNETGWLGWIQYFKEIDDSIIPFFGRSFYDETKEYGSDFVYNALPYENIIDELNHNNHKARLLFPAFKEDGCNNFTEMCQRLADYSKSNYEFIYAYWDEFDALMHKLGPSSEKVRESLIEINDEIASLKDKLDKDTLLVVIADHGQVDTKTYNLYPKYQKYFYQKPSLEFRCISLFVREELMDEFRKEFLEEFEDKFILLRHNEVLLTNLFGDHKSHPRFEEFIGEYVAIAKSDVSFVYDENDDGNYNLGQHAGCSIDELLVPVVVIQND